jgi:acyl carrier protein
VSDGPIVFEHADALAAVRDAVSVVCEVDVAGLSASTSFVELDADSLCRVSIADVVEASFLAATDRGLHIDDATLGRMESLRDLADYVAAH